MNATLAELREAIEEIELSQDLTEEGNRAVQAFNALDEWLSKGGFLPQGWSVNR